MDPEGKKTRYMRIGVWFDEESENIKISAPDVRGFKVTTVRRNPKNKRGHPPLYWKLARFLQDEGAPAPVDPEDIDV